MCDVCDDRGDAFDAATIEPTVTWGINPGQSVGIGESISASADEEALAFMGFEAGAPVRGTRIDVAFIGSCTNGRLSDLEEVAKLVNGRHVAPHVQALIVPGSHVVRQEAEARGLDKIFVKAGFREWRGPGCFDVPRHEYRPPGRTSNLRVVVEPQLQGAAGQPDRPHAADEPGDGRRRRHCR